MDIRVRHQQGDRFRVTIGAHAITVDQHDSGDAGPTPTDLFVASLAACVAHYAGRFFVRHGIAPDGFGVDCAFQIAQGRPARVGSIGMRLVLPAAFPEELTDRLRAVVEHCTVHNSILQAPEIRLDLDAAARAA